MKKTPVFFDVDDTLIDGQTQQIMASYLRRKGKLNVVPLFKIYSWFLLYKTGLVSDVLPIMKKSYQLVRGVKMSELEEILRDLLSEEIKPRFFPQALEEIEKHQREGNEVILVSNSIEPLIKIIGKELNLPLCLATSLEQKGGVFTGKLRGNIMYGEGKLRAVKKLIPERSWNLEKSYAYTDHHSDITLLKTVANPVAVNPDNRLKKEAQKYKWQILQWKRFF